MSADLTIRDRFLLGRQGRLEFGCRQGELQAGEGQQPLGLEIEPSREVTSSLRLGASANRSDNSAALAAALLSRSESAPAGVTSRCSKLSRMRSICRPRSKVAQLPLRVEVAGW